VIVRDELNYLRIINLSTCSSASLVVAVSWVDVRPGVGAGNDVRRGVGWSGAAALRTAG
jgi:hypothetical protein